MKPDYDYYIVLPFQKPKTPILLEFRCPVCGNEDKDKFLVVTSLAGSELKGAVCKPCEEATQ